MAFIDIKFETNLVTTRTLGKLARDANEATVRFHGKEHLPQHFEEGAADRFRYAKRSAKYIKRMQERFPSWRPLYRTGKLSRSVTAPRNWRVTKTKTRATLFIRAYFKMPFERRREIEAMDGQDVQELARFWTGWMTRETARPKWRTKRIHKTKVATFKPT